MLDEAPGRWFHGLYNTARDAGDALAYYHANLDAYASFGVDIREMNHAIMASGGKIPDPYGLRDHLRALCDRLESTIEDACTSDRDMLFWALARSRGKTTKEIAKQEHTAQDTIKEILARVDRDLDDLLCSRGMMTRRIQ